LFHDSDRLVASDDLRPSFLGDSLGTVKMVEVRMPDDNPIAGVNLFGPHTGPVGIGSSVDIRVEKNTDPGRPKPEGRAPIPIEGTGHYRFTISGLPFG
jgi:hypothetical protein